MVRIPKGSVFIHIQELNISLNYLGKMDVSLMMNLCNVSTVHDIYTLMLERFGFCFKLQFTASISLLASNWSEYLCSRLMIKTLSHWVTQTYLLLTRVLTLNGNS